MSSQARSRGQSKSASDEAKKRKRTWRIVLIVGAIVLAIIIIVIIVLLVTRKPAPQAGDAIVCNSDTDCPLNLRCNTGTKTCVLCVEDADCSGNANLPVCNTNAGVCVGCVNDMDCDGGNGKCSQNDFNCYDCLVDGDCPSETPFCSSVGGGECVECRFSNQCGVGEACVAGICQVVV